MCKVNVGVYLRNVEWQTAHRAQKDFLIFEAGHQFAGVLENLQKGRKHLMIAGAAAERSNVVKQSKIKNLIFFIVILLGGTVDSDHVTHSKHVACVQGSEKKPAKTLE